MAPTIPTPSRRLILEPLTPSAFAPFGCVIDNPQHYSDSRPDLRFSLGNQGTSQRWFNISNLHNFYGRAPSQTPAAPSISFAICAPRKLRRTKDGSVLAKVPDVGPDVGVKMPNHLEGLVYDVEILERHPYTPQSFIPIGLSAEDALTKYLVIVAPTLPEAASDPESYRVRPGPNSYPEVQDSEAGLANLHLRDAPRGRGSPDLDNVKVFLANGSQAVTYGPGTWHAPMAVIGPKPIEFIIVQNANGVALEDCEEVELKPKAGEAGIVVALDTLGPSKVRDGKAKL